ncbi:auxin efflux carrier [Caballeronia udeis]|uniref:Auxin efflux carrier n=1 Tax=Caballeronia udeis TaxID=1232866 RepID=A0A158GHL1_9BURK|nr:auxin efflux carrier [Caballeronia udeis]
MPAPLFDIMATTPRHTLDQPAFIAAFGLGAGGVFLLTVMIRLKQSRHLADASLDGLNAAYPNAGFIGLPLCLLAFGHASLASAVIAMILTVCVLFAVAIVLIERVAHGAGPFMLAEFYKREAEVTSGTILFSTVISLVTVCLAGMN